MQQVPAKVQRSTKQCGNCNVDLDEVCVDSRGTEENTRVMLAAMHRKYHDRMHEIYEGRDIPEVACPRCFLDIFAMVVTPDATAALASSIARDQPSAFD